jgi:hypothetical protein
MSYPQVPPLPPLHPLLPPLPPLPPLSPLPPTPTPPPNASHRRSQSPSLGLHDVCPLPTTTYHHHPHIAPAQSSSIPADPTAIFASRCPPADTPCPIDRRRASSDLGISTPVCLPACLPALPASRCDLSLSLPWFGPSHPRSPPFQPHFPVTPSTPPNWSASLPESPSLPLLAASLACCPPSRSSFNCLPGKVYRPASATSVPFPLSYPSLLHSPFIPIHPHSSPVIPSHLHLTSTSPSIPSEALRGQTVIWYCSRHVRSMLGSLSYHILSYPIQPYPIPSHPVPS